MKNRIKKALNDRQLTCDYCGKVREKFEFVIGASIGKDWVMVAGTGKVTCPDCLEKATEEGRQSTNGCGHLKYRYDGEIPCTGRKICLTCGQVI